MVALAKADNAQSMPKTEIIEVEDNAPIPLGKLPQSCRICLTTMFLKNVTSDKNSKQHIVALVKTDKNFAYKSFLNYLREKTLPKQYHTFLKRSRQFFEDPHWFSLRTQQGSNSRRLTENILGRLLSSRFLLVSIVSNRAFF